MKYLYVIILFTILITACSQDTNDNLPFKNFTNPSNPVSYGNHQDVYLFTNQTLNEKTYNLMKEQFGYPFAGAQRERTFEIIWKDFDEFESLKKAKNIIFICNLDKNDQFSAFINEKLPNNKLEPVLQGTPAILTYQNEWSDDQLLTFIIANNKEKLEEIIITRIADLYVDFEDRFLKRMTRRVYYRGISHPPYFSDKKYSIQLPETFQLYKEDEENSLVSYIYRYKKQNTVLPDKFITVYSESFNQANLDELWVKKTREKIGHLILDGDKIDWLRTDVKPKTFSTWAGDMYPGYIIEGAWENDSTKMGGSFRSFAFQEPSTNRLYFIDTSVYYPAGTKVPYLFELEGIAKSFTLKE